MKRHVDESSHGVEMNIWPEDASTWADPVMCTAFGAICARAAEGRLRHAAAAASAVASLNHMCVPSARTLAMPRFQEARVRNPASGGKKKELWKLRSGSI